MKYFDKSPEIAVLLSTYNGEKYLKAQIDSILNQEKVNIKLYIRDDGSTDNTRTILSEYMDDERVFVNFSENVGVLKSFLSLLYDNCIKSDFYAFADQDDIWLPDKLEIAVNKIKEIDGPVLYTSNQMLIDEFGKEVCLHYSKPVLTDYHSVLAEESFAGCTMVFNDELCHIIREKNHLPTDEEFKSIRYHDVWVAWVAVLTGTIIYDNNYKMLYRQHNENAVGGVDKSQINIFFQRLKKLFLKKGRNIHSEKAKIAIKYFSDYLIDKEDLYTFANYRIDRKSKMTLLKDKTYKRYITRSFLLYKLKILFNIF